MRSKFGSVFLGAAGGEDRVDGQHGGADDGGGDGVGQGGGEALSEDGVHILVVEQDIQHGSDARPADHMGGHLAQIEVDQHLPVPVGGVQAGHIGKHAQQTAEGGGGEDPAPEHLTAAQIDEDVANQASHGAGQGTAGHGQEGQQAILHADVDGGDGAGDGHIPAQQEKQQGSKGDGADALDGGVHRRPPVQVDLGISYLFSAKKSIEGDLGICCLNFYF